MLTVLPKFRGTSLQPTLRLAVLLLAALSGGVIRAQTALRAGEELTYSVRWAVLPGAGQIRIAASARPEAASPQLSITTHTETRGLAKSVMSFKARSESIFDQSSGRLITLHESSVARAKQVEYSLRFDYENEHAWFQTAGAETPRIIEMPEGDPSDLITTLLKTRLWDLSVGQSRDVLVSFRDDFYELTVYAVKTERVKTPMGDFECLVLEPRMEKTPPKGMFKRGAAVRVWVSRDSLRLPVRFQVEFKVGTGVATLVNYVPPTPISELRTLAEE